MAFVVNWGLECWLNRINNLIWRWRRLLLRSALVLLTAWHSWNSLARLLVYLLYYVLWLLNDLAQVVDINMLWRLSEVIWHLRSLDWKVHLLLGSWKIEIGLLRLNLFVFLWFLLFGFWLLVFLGLWCSSFL